MSSQKGSQDRFPFLDVTNTSSTSVGDGLQSPALSSKELKKQRDREQYLWNKEEIPRRKRERKAKSKQRKTLPDNPGPCGTNGKENIALDESDVWLHRNDAYFSA
ncbi:hypothetical protein ACP4OV_021333 [Aristida adscensionis]